MTIRFYLEHSDDDADTMTVESTEDFKFQVWNNSIPLETLLFNHTTLPFVEAKDIKVDDHIMQHDEPYWVKKIERE